MNRRSSNTTWLALALALGLFLIANHFDDSSRWQPRELSRTSLNPPRESGLRGPVRTEQSSGGCDAAESEMLRTVENSRNCATDDDCTLFDYGYPIQCMTSVSNSEITALRRQYGQYEASCRFRVYYDCDIEGAQRRAVCRSDRCTVELETLDLLKDETLHHLGIEP
ncbi:MAG TPA: hypothetical protein VGA68_10790 [Woeseiaceae bacterium]